MGHEHRESSPQVRAMQATVGGDLRALWLGVCDRTRK